MVLSTFRPPFTAGAKRLVIIVNATGSVPQRFQRNEESNNLCPCRERNPAYSVRPSMPQRDHSNDRATRINQILFPFFYEYTPKTFRCFTIGSLIPYLSKHKALHFGLRVQPLLSVCAATAWILCYNTKDNSTACYHLDVVTVRT